jgi:hypothetical protein
MNAAAELKHIIMQHVAEENRDRALLLLKAIEQRRYCYSSCHAMLDPTANKIHFHH